MGMGRRFLDSSLVDDVDFPSSIGRTSIFGDVVVARMDQKEYIRGLAGSEVAALSVAFLFVVVLSIAVYIYRRSSAPILPVAVRVMKIFAPIFTSLGRRAQERMPSSAIGTSGLRLALASGIETMRSRMKRKKQVHYMKGHSPVYQKEVVAVLQAFLLEKEDAREVLSPDWACPMCMEGETAWTSAYCFLPCEHVLHRHCMRAWLYRGDKTCPVCEFSICNTHSPAPSPAASAKLSLRSRCSCTSADPSKSTAASIDCPCLTAHASCATASTGHSDTPPPPPAPLLRRESSGHVSLMVGPAHPSTTPALKIPEPVATADDLVEVSLQDPPPSSWHNFCARSASSSPSLRASSSVSSSWTPGERMTAERRSWRQRLGGSLSPSSVGIETQTPSDGAASPKEFSFGATLISRGQAILKSTSVDGLVAIVKRKA